MQLSPAFLKSKLPFWSSLEAHSLAQLQVIQRTWYQAAKSSAQIESCRVLRPHTFFHQKYRSRRSESDLPCVCKGRAMKEPEATKAISYCCQTNALGRSQNWKNFLDQDRPQTGKVTLDLSTLWKDVFPNDVAIWSQMSINGANGRTKPCVCTQSKWAVSCCKPNFGWCSKISSSSRSERVWGTCNSLMVCSAHVLTIMRGGTESWCNVA